MKKQLLFFMGLLCLSMGQVFAQERTIAGKITTKEDGSSLPGVNIIVKGTTTGTTTDADGNYSIKIPSDGRVLVFSFIGYTSQEITIGEQTKIDIALLTDSKQLSEVVVTALGIAREKKALGYTVQDVKGEQLVEARSQNVVNGLSGKIAGVRISPNSGPGSGSTIQVRGPATIGSNNQPLVVIDGVPIEQTSSKQFGGGISEVSADNIASISVLKGPASTALYGSRGQNGVILITTKNGEGTKGIGIEFNSNLTFESPLVKPQFQNTYGGGNGYRTWYNDGWSGAITDPTQLAQYRAVYPSYWPATGTEGTDESWGSPMDGRLVRHWWSGTEVAPLTPNSDNWEEFWNTGKTFTNNIAINGGNEKGSFRLSVGKMTQEGIMAFNDYFRNNFKLNSIYNFTPKFGATLSAEYIKSGSDNRSYTSGQEFIWAHRQTDWTLHREWERLTPTHIQRQVAGRPADTDPPNWQHTFFTNPYYLQEKLPLSNEKDRILGNVAISYKPFDFLNIILRSGTDMWSDTRINVINFERRRNGNLTPGRYSEEVLRSQETNTDLIANFNKNFADFSVGAMIGGLSRTNYYKRNYVFVNDLVVDGVYNLSNSVPSTNLVQSEISKKESQSVFGSLQLGWKNALFLDATARNDWTSSLPAANRSYFYPSVALSAVITDLLGFQSNIISFGKVRASYAEVGNDTDPYRLQQVFVSRGSWNGNIPLFGDANTLYNPTLRPERTKGYELGLDVRFFKNRLSLDVTYYDQNTFDQIIDVEVPKSSGYDRRIANLGKVSNKGIEIILTGTAVKLNNGFTWEVGANFAKNVNKVVDLGELPSYTIASQNGLFSLGLPNEPLGSLVGVGFEYSPDGQKIYKDGLPVVATGTRILGNFQPKWSGGLQNTFSFKGITLAALIDARMGGSIFDLGTGIARWTGQYAETAAGREEGLIGDGVKADGVNADGSILYVPNDVVVSTNQLIGYNNPRRYHEAGIFDGSYVKLREVSLGYTIPKAFSQRFYIQNMKVSLVGRNMLMLFSNHPHIDPEIDRNGGNGQGFGYGELPPTRSLGFNVSLGF
ncbi:MAG: SusC/RagA family TonB-linked outer membrane protein [Verrucomicrobia bacterium]|nr:SusC/RagA family TonB-linked outer membrane protein [Cytophagales bacterium]